MEWRVLRRLDAHLLKKVLLTWKSVGGTTRGHDQRVVARTPRANIKRRQALLLPTIETNRTVCLSNQADCGPSALGGNRCEQQDPKRLCSSDCSVFLCSPPTLPSTVAPEKMAYRYSPTNLVKTPKSSRLKTTVMPDCRSGCRAYLPCRKNQNQLK